MIIILLLFGLNLNSQDIKELLPALEELPGWKFNQEPQVYEGDNLFELINGGADIYLEYGFSQMVTSQFTDPSQNNIQVEIYEMVDDPSAYGIFSITQQTAVWSAEYGSLSAVNDDYIAFWKEKYYVNLSWSSRQHIEKPLLYKLASMMTGKIKEHGEYPLMAKDFLINDTVVNTIYLKGNLALSNFYYFDYKDIFQLQQGLAWNMGDYRRILVKYSDPVKAVEVINSLRQSITGNKRFTDVTASFQGFSCLDNKGNRVLARQVDEFIVVLVGMGKEISLVPLMDDISLKIESFSR